MRFSHDAIDGALGRVTPSMEVAARTLESSRRRVLARIHAPVIRGSRLKAALLIFGDSVKELAGVLVLARTLNRSRPGEIGR